MPGADTKTWSRSLLLVIVTTPLTGFETVTLGRIRPSRDSTFRWVRLRVMVRSPVDAVKAAVFVVARGPAGRFYRVNQDSAASAAKKTRRTAPSACEQPV